MARKQEIDTTFLYLTYALVAVGFVIFLSAALGLFATEQLSLTSILIRQVGLGIGGGLLVMYGISQIPPETYRPWASWLFFGALGLCLLVFVPGLGFSHGGASRWIDLGIITFQPVELLKVGFVIYCAGWATHIGKDIETWRQGAVPFGIILAMVGAVLLAQPDTGSFLVICLAAGAIFVAAGARWLHIAGIGGIAACGLGLLSLWRPYIQERLFTFLNPASNPFGAGYQIRQSLIAVGSGEWIGRGAGQSVQKFNFVPEPVSDSIFAVFAEEWGFIGAVILIGLFVAFTLRGYKIAKAKKDTFSRLLVVGIISLVIGQAFVNIASIIGLMPLTGLPLIFVSHGGTALVAALASVGIVLSASRTVRL